jgi:hypothetical protein
VTPKKGHLDAFRFAFVSGHLFVPLHPVVNTASGHFRYVVLPLPSSTHTYTIVSAPLSPRSNSSDDASSIDRLLTTSAIDRHFRFKFNLFAGIMFTPTHRPTNSIWLWLLLCVVSLCVRSSLSFNFDTKSPIFKHGTKGSYFGFSIALHLAGQDKKYAIRTITRCDRPSFAPPSPILASFHAPTRSFAPVSVSWSAHRWPIRRTFVSRER